MIKSLALIFISGLALAYICKKIKVPSLIGMLLSGIILGPHVLKLLDPSIMSISAELRKIALIVILLKAGFSLDLKDMKKVGRPAVLLSFVPASFEIAAYTILAPKLLGISTVEAALMGAVLGAVSPAVVVPKMVKLMEAGYGTEKGIPQMILAGASCDDIFVIVLFTTFMGMAEGDAVSFSRVFTVPISIVTGVLIGAVTGYLLHIMFEKFYRNKSHIRNSVKLIIILAIAFLLTSLEKDAQTFLPMSGLLAVMSMAAVLKMKSSSAVSLRLGEKLGKLWIASEIVLFVLVGAAVDVRYTLKAGLPAVALILAALAVRSVGVYLSTACTPLNSKERLFTAISYLPKATVQAAIGSAPLAAGLSCGNAVLSVAVCAILITAPLGAAAMEFTHKGLLTSSHTSCER